MIKKILLSIMCATAVTAGAQEPMKVLTEAEVTALAGGNTKTLQSVHDPSIYYDEATKTYYLVGTHLGMAKSPDLASWSNIWNGNFGINLLVGGSFTNAFKECPTHEVQVKNGSTVTTKTLGSFDAGAFCAIYNANGTESHIPGNQWAPDMVYNPVMKKWCMYLSLNGDNWASVIVLLTSDSPEGPFKYEAPIIFGGFNGQSYSGKSVSHLKTDLPLVLGSNTLPGRYSGTKGSWGTYYPNCIDPCVFYDDEGELWMSYGSWSGGIWIIKLDKNTGLRDYTTTYGSNLSSASATADDPYFGKRIAGGYYVSGEGSYIQKIGNYYYLFMSYGFMLNNWSATSQDKGGGYEMRIFRSANPDGPYTDMNGVSAKYTSGMQNRGKNAATNRGARVLGAYNKWGPMSLGERCQGHNSAIVGADGEAYLIFHTRFNHYADNQNDEGHQIRVHRLYTNENGWLCASPFRYAGSKSTATDFTMTTQSDIDTRQLLTKKLMAGKYQCLIHPYKLDYQTAQEATPVELTLTEDGKIIDLAGTYNGTWEYTQEGKSYIKLKIGPGTYYGVVMQQEITDSKNIANCITAVRTKIGSTTDNNAGEAVWLYKLEDRTAIAKNISANTIFTTTSNTSNSMPLLTDGVRGTYRSSMPEVMDVFGIYGYQPSSKRRQSLSVTLERGDYTYNKTKNVTMGMNTADAKTGLVAYYDLKSVNSVNECNTAQAITIGNATTAGKKPEIYRDEQMGNVMHQFFYAQGSCCYARMDNPLIGSNATGITIGFWVNSAKVTNWDCILSFFDGEKPADAAGRFYITDNLYIGYNDNAGSWYDINHPSSSTALALTVGQWKYVTVTISPTATRLYINGVLQTNKSFDSSAGATASAFDYAATINTISKYKYMCLGMGSFWGSANCLVSSLSVFNRDLSATEAQQLYYLNMPHEKMGDVNGDGFVNNDDAKGIVNYYLGTPVPFFDKRAADMNADGNITMQDANGVVNKR